MVALVVVVVFVVVVVCAPRAPRHTSGIDAATQAADSLNTVNTLNTQNTQVGGGGRVCDSRLMSSTFQILGTRYEQHRNNVIDIVQANEYTLKRDRDRVRPGSTQRAQSTQHGDVRQCASTTTRSASMCNSGRRWALSRTQRSAITRSRRNRLSCNGYSSVDSDDRSRHPSAPSR